MINLSAFRDVNPWPYPTAGDSTGDLNLGMKNYIHFKK
jgi:hypothetical protein